VGVGVGVADAAAGLSARFGVALVPGAALS
jgi:hypothetical protein